MEEIFTTDERRQIAGRARTLHERLSGPSNENGPDPRIDPEQIVETWSKQFPDEETFQARLEGMRVTETGVQEEIAATCWPTDQPLPGWMKTLESLGQYLQTRSRNSERTVPDDKAFAEFLIEVTEYARERLPTDRILEDEISPMVDWLVKRVASLCVRPLYVEFKSFVKYHDAELARTDPSEVDDPPTEYYDRFIDSLFEHGFKNLCLEYPVLARQLALLIEQWIDNVVEICQRVRTDKDTLRSQFGVTGEVTALKPLSDDAHAKGQTPIHVSFDSGDVIYKPRPVDGGLAFYEILDRLNEHLAVPSFEKPRYVSRDSYGWMELIQYNELSDEDAVTRYYERAGAIVCIAYALNLTDCQFENLIVDGEYPMIIDGETLCHPHYDAEKRPTPAEVSNFAHRTVLLTLLLPWSVGNPSDAHEGNLGVSNAGLGDKSGRMKNADRTRPFIKAINTDVMSIVEEEVEVDHSTNTPSIDGDDYPPRESADSLVRGFEETYETIRELHSDGYLFSNIITDELIDDIENRFLYRATARYGSILRSSTGREPLLDGSRLSVEFEKLAVPFFDGRGESNRHWSLYEAERRALRRRDVPRFTSRPKRRTLFHDGQALSVKADTAGYERCRRRIEDMDEADRDLQTWLIRRTLRPKITTAGKPPAAERPEESFREEAVALFDEVIDAATESPEQNRWMSISPTESGIKLIPTDPSLYRGRAGIALTAAALYEVTAEERYRGIVDDTLEPVCERIEDGELNIGHGGMLGLGSVVYALSVIADLLDAEEYRRAALKATRAMTDTVIESDETFDIVEGSAGTLLGFLAYYERYGEAEVLDRAISCGDRLLEGRVEMRGNRTWKTAENDSPLTGFSHGASGIAYALARLAAVTGESRFAEAAREGLDFESDLYDEERRNWAKSPENETYDDKWCHGRSGMALARIEIGDRLGDESLRTNANEVLAETAAEGASSADHVCCGNFGRAEALLVGSRRGISNREDAIELARRCLTRRKRDEALSLPGHSEVFVNPSFFQGITGVAYTLLRLENPDLLPSVLLME